MRNPCGGFVVETTSCCTEPASPVQTNAVAVGAAGIGLGVNVAGMGLGVKVTVWVGVDETNVWVGTLWFDGEQAESPMRSARQVIMIFA
jgi:hypothetical protein